MSWSRGNAAAYGHNPTPERLQLQLPDSSASAWDKPEPGVTLTALARVWVLPSVGGWREPTVTREVCGEAQGQEAEQWGALHLFEVKWKQLTALLPPISAQEPGLAQGILPAPRKCGNNQPWQCFSEQSHSTGR